MQEFRNAIKQIVLDSICSFKPEIIFFSVEFDDHEQDSIINIVLSEFDYFWVTQQIKEIAGRYSQERIVPDLERGYALGVLGQCLVVHLNG